MIIGLGGNTGQTLDALSRSRFVFDRILNEARFSSLYLTEPQMDPDQPRFWNAAAVGGWEGTPESLLERLLMLEARFGRQRDPARPKGPRVIDLDLLVFGDAIRISRRLNLPHGGILHRRFALEPLVELIPDARDPRDGWYWRDRLAALPSQGVDRTDRTW